MDFVLANSNWVWIAVALISGGLLLAPVLQGGGRGVTPIQAVQLINREKAVVVDVCEPAEFQAGHVGGAKNIPLGELEKQLPGAVKNKAVPLVLVCASGARSGRAAAIARKLGYEKAQSLAGGMKSWRDASLPVERA